MPKKPKSSKRIEAGRINGKISGEIRKDAKGDRTYEIENYLIAWNFDMNFHGSIRIMADHMHPMILDFDQEIRVHKAMIEYFAPKENLNTLLYGAFRNCRHGVSKTPISYRTLKDVYLKGRPYPLDESRPNSITMEELIRFNNSRKKYILQS